MLMFEVMKKHITQCNSVALWCVSTGYGTKTEGVGTEN